MSRDHHTHGSSGNLKVAFFLNLTFTIIEIIGRLWTNSIAILADAVHDAGDTASLGLAWYFENISKRGRLINTPSDSNATASSAGSSQVSS